VPNHLVGIQRGPHSCIAPAHDGEFNLLSIAVFHLFFSTSDIHGHYCLHPTVVSLLGQLGVFFRWNWRTNIWHLVGPGSSISYLSWVLRLEFFFFLLSFLFLLLRLLLCKSCQPS
ncbi:hypothetical protein HOY82DRAFT_506069, partial [Tuber indicum]